MITVLRDAKHPVLAHTFLNFLLDNENALQNFTFNGYMPPLTSIQPAKLVSQGYIPANLTSTDRPRVGLREGRDHRRADDGRSDAVGERVVDLQGRLSGPGTRAGPTTRRWFWPSFAFPGAAWLVLLFLVPTYAVIAVAFGTVDPIFQTPVPVWNPLDWQFGTMRTVLGRARAGPHLLDRVSSGRSGTSRSRSRAAC